VSRGLVCEFIAAEKTTYGVRRLCRVFKLSPTSFYAWAARSGGPTAAELEDAYAIEAARSAWVEHRRIYGARRLTAEVRDRGHAWNRKRVARLMRLGAIEGVHRRRRGKYGRRSISTATAPDRVERNFTADAPNQLWVADISYLRSWEGFVYLAVVVDAFSRKVVGWAMADHLRTELVLDAVGMAITARKPAAGTVHHTDRGSPSTPPMSSARRCAPRACWPRWAGSAPRSTMRWPSRCSPP
jgi:putative transposase